MTEPTPTRSLRMAHALRRLLLPLLLLPLLGAAADNEQATIAVNFSEADIRTVIEAVSAATGRNFIIDPRVKASVTITSSSKMTPSAFYEAFLSILEVHDYVAIPSGDVIKIVPSANARQLSGEDSPPAGDDMITRVVEVRNVGAAQLVPILRPLMPQYGHLAAHPPSNMLILSDRAANVSRILRIIHRIDQVGDEEIEVIPLEHASAGELVRILTTLLNPPGSQQGGSPEQATLVADERTNSVLIGGERATRLKIRTLIAHLDTPLEAGGNTQVRYLRYADADTLAQALQQQISAVEGGEGAQAAAQATGSNRTTIWADPETNALVITASPEQMTSMKTIIDKLDIRRAQVKVEAIIVEINSDKASELGVTWALDGAHDDGIGVGVTDFASGGIVDLAGLVTGGADAVAGLGSVPDGLNFGVGRIRDSGTSFALLLRALVGDATTNILSTPNIVTMDNQEAEINVGQEVPFRTGSFTNTGGTVGQVNPFQTIQRQDVGIKLKITPQINEGDAVMLAIELESSSIAQGVSGAADLITNKRTINNNVIIEDGGIIVLGGLIDENLLESDQRVPVLGSIPVIGNIFRSRSTSKVKRNLMVFIRPVILRDAATTAVETNSKYQYMRDLQLGADRDRVQLMRGEQRPVMPPLDITLPPADPAPVEPRDYEDVDPGGN